MRGLIDRSGSMAAWRKPVVEGVNAYLQTVNDDKAGRDADILIVTFDSMGYDPIRKGKVVDIDLIRDDEFVPRGLTPLFDATDSALNDNVDESGGVKNILWILTDGLENASKKHRTTASIRALVEDKRKKGWLILFLGANIDAWKTAADMGIPPEHTMNVHVQGRNQQPAPGIFGRMIGSKSNPVGMALAAAAGLGLAYALLRPGDAQAAPLGFTEHDRNAAMGVDGTTTTWQDAVQQDIASFNEPMNDIFDLPDDLHQAVSELPANFDPSQGSLLEDGTQSGGMNFDATIVSAEDAPTSPDFTGSANEGNIDTSNGRSELETADAGSDSGFGGSKSGDGSSSNVSAYTSNSDSTDSGSSGDSGGGGDGGGGGGD